MLVSRGSFTFGLYYDQDFQACASVASSEGICVAPIDDLLTELIMQENKIWFKKTKNCLS